jgi:hypothetical protein
MKTEDSNKLIAEFDGVKLTDRNGESAVFMIEGSHIAEYFRCTKYNTYHEDWNMLMPVVEKIEALDGLYIVEIFARACIISYMVNHNWPEDKGIVAHFNASNTNSKLEATYQAVVQFIQWYNQNH